MRTPPGPKAVAVLAEGGVHNWLNYLPQCLLDQPVRHRRYTQLALATIGLGDRYSAYRAGAVRPCQRLLANHRPLGCQMLGRLLYVQSVHPGGSLVGPYPLERSQQALSCQRRLQQRRARVLGFMSREAPLRRWQNHARLHRALPRPSRFPGHLTQCWLHRHGLELFSSFGP
jgi:hypothetical protein